MSRSKIDYLLNKSNMKVAVYCRVDRQDDSIIERQEHIIREYANEHGYDNLIVYADNGVSGIELDRPALGRLSTDILAGHIKTVIVVELSRISRSSFERSDWISGIRRCGTSLMSIQEGITDDEFAKTDDLFLRYCKYFDKQQTNNR